MYSFTVLITQSVEYLENALVAEQQVRRLQVTVENPVVMEMADTSQQLNHQGLDFPYERRRERPELLHLQSYLRTEKGTSVP